ncbi:MAG: alpha-2,8-polysialyltransferase family protein [Burkholderiaceae bacterium]|nr:alpha-2,8-polysialyltransferase family protein [Burkholderiaceae bacterium]
MAGSGRLLLLARSSLQLVLAAAAAQEALEAAGQRSWLIFLPDVADRQGFERTLQAWPESPFERVVFVEPRSAAGQATGRSWRSLQRELTALLQAAAPSSVAIFNDREEAGQCLLIAAAKYFPAARRECIEDGSQAYTDRTYRRLGLLTRWRQRLRYGAGWQDVRVLGTHPLVQCFVALQPAQVREALRTRTLRAFPGHRLDAAPLRALARRFAAQAGFEAASLPAGAVLLTLSHSSYARRNPDYLRRVQATVAEAQRLGLRLSYKYHPREAEPDPLGLGRSGACELPRQLPAESLYLLVRDRPLLVVAGISTALLTAALLMPRARFVALAHASQTGDVWRSSLMAALNIVAPDDEAGVAAQLADWRAQADLAGAARQGP